MFHPDDQLVLGRGRVYFDPFTQGTRVGQGERYIGNTSTFQVTREVERQARMISVGGRRIETEGAIVRENHSVTFVTDSVDLDNLADFFGQRDQIAVAAEGFVTETLTCRKGRYFQLGRSRSPFGVRHALVISVVVGGVHRPLTDYDFDTATGRIYFPLTSQIADGATVSVTWETRQQTLSHAKSTATELWGALRFISDNAEGENKHVYLPCVRLFARGAVDFKGDQWQQLPFEAEATNLTPAVPQVLVDLMGDPGPSEDMLWLQANPIPDFELHEDALNQSINFDWAPSLHLGPVYQYDAVTGVEIPADAGARLVGFYDLVVDGTDFYFGLAAPFARPQVNATTIAAYPSALLADQVAMLHKTGARTLTTRPLMVLRDDDIWSLPDA